MTRFFQIMAIGLMLTFVACNQSETNSSSTNAEANDQVSEQTPASHSDKQEVTDNGDLKPIYLTTAEFKEKVWDYENNPEAWVYQGEIPCVVDFYADWCKPCKMVAPIMDDLADYYNGKVQIYKVNTDNEKELSMVFQIRSIPSVLFVPMQGKPAMQAGAMQKEDYIRIIDENILKTNKGNDKTQS